MTNHADPAGGKTLLLLWLLLLLPAVLSAPEPRDDPETGRIRLLFTGELHGNVNLFADWYRLEPRIDIDIVSCSTQEMSLKDAKRQVRLYMPRSYDQPVAKYDCVLIEDLNPEVLSPSFTTDLRNGVVDQGLRAILELVRKARSLITRTDDVRNMVFSVLEFAEMFGAKTR